MSDCFDPFMVREDPVAGPADLDATLARFLLTYVRRSLDVELLERASEGGSALIERCPHGPIADHDLPSEASDQVLSARGSHSL